MDLYGVSAIVTGGGLIRLPQRTPCHAAQTVARRVAANGPLSIAASKRPAAWTGR
jgi:hypothetical protein